MSAFDPNTLLGQPESHHLEFKQADILRNLPKVAREVVGFLNADGGDLWIGFKEEASRAISVDPIAEPTAELRRVRDHLIDTIEPAVQIPGEVRLDIEGGLLHLVIAKGNNPPYAQRTGGGRFFLKRVDERLRDMSRDELVDAFRDKPRKEEAHANRLKEVNVSLRRAQAEEGASRPQLWLRLIPLPALAIDFDAPETQVQFRSWLTDPQTTGNRRNGWNFAVPTTPKFGEGRVRNEVDKDGAPLSERTRVGAGGEITFSADRDLLYWKGNDQDPRDIWPFAILEFPISVFRLMAKILESQETRSVSHVVAGISLNGIRGWRLRPGSPKEPTRPWLATKEFGQDLLDPNPIAFTAAELMASPDRCGFRLVRLIYESVDLDSDAIPREFDRKQGLLVLG